jgi:hypothetical protein
VFRVLLGVVVRPCHRRTHGRDRAPTDEELYALLEAI